jgi:uncharacterized protein
MPEPRDDNLMNRFDQAGLRRFRAREGVIAVLIAALIMVLCAGPSILKAGNEMTPGIGRDIVLAVGRPSNWISSRLPFVSVANATTGWLNPEPNLSGPAGFDNAKKLATGQIPAVTTTAFSPTELGEATPPRKPLHTLLVTGDSMSEPLDHDLAETLIPKGVHVIQEPHIGTGISTTFVVDWGALSAEQVKHNHPEAVVVFIGANDGFPMEDSVGHQVECCGASWAAIYANRVRQMMNTYRQNGAAHVYWITLPAPRDPARQRIVRVVNAAIKVAAQPWASQVQIIDSVPIFTPGFVYRDAMSLAGKQTIVREADGIHLNEAGSSWLARYVLEDIRQNFTY